MAQPAGDDHLLPRFRRAELEREQLRVPHRETRRALDDGLAIVVRGYRDPVDGRLRGIPAIGRGTAGSEIRGTRPDRAILNLGRRR